MAEPVLPAPLTGAQLKDVNEALDKLQTILSPLYVQLDSEAIRRLAKMGDKSVSFVQDALQAAQNNAATLPTTFSTDDFAKATELQSQMRAVELRLEQITSGVTNMAMLSGSSAMNRANQAYGFFQMGERTNPALSPIVQALSERYKRAKSESAPAKLAAHAS